VNARQDLLTYLHFALRVVARYDNLSEKDFDMMADELMKRLDAYLDARACRVTSGEEVACDEQQR
jgi:hypothetical protein